MVVSIIAITSIITGLLLFVLLLTRFFEFEILKITELASAVLIGFTSVIGYMTRENKNKPK
jgi:hypothetical protein